MRPGEVVADRFEIESSAGRGGMGHVYRARDRVSGATVALKVMGAAAEESRFLREAQVLAGLRHPAIVSYVSHGITPAGMAWLAMEWLEGETLRARLSRGGLSISESVGIVARLGDALGVVHAHGLVHRDMKPSNVLLVDGSLERAKVIDFGVVRMATEATMLTATGALVGTPHYMAPEQARGSTAVDARADVFALGCILYRCIAGRTPFAGNDISAVLAKILFEAPPPLRSIVPAVSPELDDLIARALAKDPALRPANGEDLSTKLREIVVTDGAMRAPAAEEPVAITSNEQRVVSVIVARGARDGAVTVGALDTVVDYRAGAGGKPLDQVVAPFGARLEGLVDGTLVATLSSAGNATDLAAKAARCALAMRAHLQGVRLVLATGRARLGELAPVGEAIERALAQVRGSAVDPNAQRAGPSPPPIRLDDVTAGLLDARFDVRSDGEQMDWHSLFGEKEIVDAARMLLGKPTPHVGRARELALLESIHEQCLSEPVASVVLVTAPPGVGKSRLRREYLAALRARGHAKELWIGRGDAMRAGSPFTMIAPWLRSSAAILDGEPLPSQRRKIAARVARAHRSSSASRSTELRRITAFIGELVSIPFEGDDVGDDVGAQLQAARRDGMLMADQLRRAWEDFVSAECEVQPVMLVLDDLHWGDLPSVQFVDAILRNLRDRPLLVVAFARPEVHDIFPAIWQQRGLVEVRLTPLGKRASSDLVRAVLGEVVQTVVDAIVERAEGNALYLEELIRAASEGKSDALPMTVLAMVQARLETLPPEGRRVLRAASVFGGVFWRGGVQALLGGSGDGVDLDAWIRLLVEREVIVSRGEGRFPGAQEYTFRHALVRDAAYAMLLDHDRVTGHALAAVWLEAAGERDALALAEHFERGGEPARALGFYLRAAEQALGGNDLTAAVERAERGIRCGAEGETLGALRRVQVEAHRWLDQTELAIVAAQDAFRVFRPGSTGWCGVAGELALLRGRTGEADQIAAIASALADVVVEADARPALAGALARASVQLLFVGEHDKARALLPRLEELGSSLASTDHVVAARLHWARAFHAQFAGDVANCRAEFAEALGAYQAAGDLRNVCIQRGNLGNMAKELGLWSASEEMLRAVIRDVERLGLQNPRAVAMHNLGFVLARRGRLPEALAVESEARDGLRAHGDRHRVGGLSSVYLAMIHTLAGRPQAAEIEARTSVDELAAVSPFRPFAIATLARAIAAQGRNKEALGVAHEAFSLREKIGEVEEGECFIALVLAETLLAASDHASARGVLQDARSALLARADRIRDTDLRRSFLEEIPEHARTLALAREWLDERVS